jgi:dTDP-4-dehydrorhamnose 3,5-epimerase-like enzyme
LLTDTETALPGCVVIRAHRVVDERGTFVTSFHAPSVEALGLDLVVRETFWSTLSSRDQGLPSFDDYARNPAFE